MDNIDICLKGLSQTKGISIGSLNARSVFRNLDEIEYVLKESKMDVLLVQESFLNSYVSD